MWNCGLWAVQQQPAVRPEVYKEAFQLLVVTENCCKSKKRNSKEDIGELPYEFHFPLSFPKEKPKTTNKNWKDWKRALIIVEGITHREWWSKPVLLHSGEKQLKRESMCYKVVCGTGEVVRSWVFALVPFSNKGTVEIVRAQVHSKQKEVIFHVTAHWVLQLPTTGGCDAKSSLGPKEALDEFTKEKSRESQYVDRNNCSKRYFLS